MKKRIALISTNRHKDPYPVYPLATAYLKSYLEENMPSFSVDIIDLNMTSNDELAQYLTRVNPQYVCVSIRNVDGANSLDRRSFFSDYKDIVDTIKKHSRSPIIIGGAGFSIFPDQFVRELNADYGISGEGEDALCQLINALEDKAPIDNIQRLHAKDFTCTAECKYISSPHAKYEPHLVDFYYKHSGMMNIQTKRGCPYNCIYCTYPLIDGRKVRTMDADRLVDTIAKAKKDFGIKYWFFTDSVFNINKSYNNELCQKLVKADLGISWGAYFSPSNINNEEMELYKASGLTHIEFGTESFCDKTLEAYGKNFTFEDIYQTSELALKHNVYYSHFLILAGWGETKQQLCETIENSKRLNHTVIFPYVGMRIYPNTILYEKALNDGVITRDSDLIMPHYYLQDDFDLEETKQMAEATGKAWVFPDAPPSQFIEMLKLKRNKKGPLWEYLRKP